MKLPITVTLGDSSAEFSPTLNNVQLTHAHFRIGSHGHVAIPVEQLDEVIGWLTEAKHEASERNAQNVVRLEPKGAGRFTLRAVNGWHLVVNR